MTKGRFGEAAKPFPVSFVPQGATGRVGSDCRLLPVKPALAARGVLKGFVFSS